jgi:hypothetical protein
MSTQWHEVEVSKFEGQPVLTIPVGWNGEMTFGYHKAVVLSLYAEEIKTFYTSLGRKGSPKVVISEYKNKAIIEIPTHNPKRPFKFGIRKAEAIIKNLEHIDRFVAETEEDMRFDQ